MSTTQAVTAWQADVIRRIQFSYGGPEEYWVKIINAYFATEPFLVGDDDSIEVQHDYPEAFSAVVDETLDGEPITAGEAIDDWRIGWFLDQEFYWSTKSQEEQAAARPSWVR